jgi:hypothetical protein
MQTSFELLPISPEQLPAAAALNFWWKAKVSLDGPRCIPPDFDGLFVVEHGSASTFIARHRRAYEGSGDQPETHAATYFADLDSGEKLIGYGEVDYLDRSNDEYYVNKPFVAWTKTEEDYQRSGLGLDRLLIMNAASLLLDGLPLHSSTNFRHPSARSRWQALVTEGLAMSYQQEHASFGSETVERFRFIAP